MASHQHLTLRAAPVEREQRAHGLRVRFKRPRKATQPAGDGGRTVGKPCAPAAKIESSDEPVRIDHAATEELVGSLQERVVAE